MKATNFIESFLPFSNCNGEKHQFNIVCGSNVVCTAKTIQEANAIKEKLCSCFPDYEYIIIDTLSQK